MTVYSLIYIQEINTFDSYIICIADVYGKQLRRYSPNFLYMSCDIYIHGSVIVIIPYLPVLLIFVPTLDEMP